MSAKGSFVVKRITYLQYIWEIVRAQWSQLLWTEMRENRKFKYIIYISLQPTPSQKQWSFSYEASLENLAVEERLLLRGKCVFI